MQVTYPAKQKSIALQLTQLPLALNISKYFPYSHFPGAEGILIGSKMPLKHLSHPEIWESHFIHSPVLLSYSVDPHLVHYPDAVFKKPN